MRAIATDAPTQTRAEVVFDEPQIAITPGQAVVFYDGDVGGRRRLDRLNYDWQWEIRMRSEPLDLILEFCISKRQLCRCSGISSR